MKELQVLIKDKNTLVLLQDGQAGDEINLLELTNVDLSGIEEVINRGRDQVYEKKLNEVRLVLQQEKTQALEVLKLALNSKHIEETNKLNQEIETYNSNKQLEIEKISSGYKLEIEKLKQELQQTKIEHEQIIENNILELKNKHIEETNKLNQTIESYNSNKQLEIERLSSNYKLEIEKLKQELQQLKSQQEQTIENNILEVKNKYIEEINNLKQQLATLKPEHELALEQLKNEYESKISKLNVEHVEEISKKDALYNELQNRKASLNIKMIGEELEVWCHNEMQSYMQNGFLNCKWTKDNKVVKEDGEASGSKADFIFNIYASEALNDDELLASVCLEMKDENPNSVHRKKNADYLSALHKNRVKKGCKYAILVSNLELDNPNDIPILKVREYEDMYIVRPAYMIVLLNMITSLTVNFKGLLLEAHKEELEMKAKLDFLTEFEALKKTYLENGITKLEKQIGDIKKQSATILEAADKIDALCNNIINGYLREIQDKLDKFEVKINREYKKLEKNSN